MTTKEVAQICGVTEECVRQNAKVIGVELGNRWHPHDWTEDELKKIQLVLMKNGVNAGGQKTENSTVKSITQSTLGEGLAVNIIADSGNVEAMKEYCEVWMQRVQAQHDLLLEQRRNKELESKNEQLQIELDESKEWYTIKRMQMLNPDKTFDWRILKEESEKLGYERKDTFDSNYGSVKAYHIKVWESLYFDSINY